MAAATTGNGGQQTWVPYEPGKDCSMGFCSVYCPQWCYIIFPPPPPVEFSEDDGSSPTFSPLVIAIIGILASAFLLVSYYTIITKYCGGFDSLRRRLSSPGHEGRRRSRELDDSLGQLQRHEAWHVSPSDGLDDTLISKITIYKYKRGDGFVEGADCSVCLGEFREDDSLRLLPKCSHAFHVQCIDTWLRSHSNCPLCRANIVSVHLASPPPPAQLPSPPSAAAAAAAGSREAGGNDEIVIVLDGLVIGGEENHLQNCGNNLAKEESSSIAETGNDRDHNSQAQAAIRRSFSLDSCSGDRLSIADVLQMSMEDEISAAKDSGLWTGASSSRRALGDQGGKGSDRSRSLPLVMSPVAMKRSSAKFCLTRNGRGRNGGANSTQDDSTYSTT